jgi:hypothetical protein
VAALARVSGGRRAAIVSGGNIDGGLLGGLIARAA